MIYKTESMTKISIFIVCQILFFLGNMSVCNFHIFSFYVFLNIFSHRKKSRVILNAQFNIIKIKFLE